MSIPLLSCLQYLYIHGTVKIPCADMIVLKSPTSHEIIKLNQFMQGLTFRYSVITLFHDDVIKWKHFPRYWPFVRGIHRFPMNSPHKGQWRGTLMFSLICVWISGWVNNDEAGDLRRYRTHHAVTVMKSAMWYVLSGNEFLVAHQFYIVI